MDKILFISRTSYHLLFSFLLNEHLKYDYETFLISSSLNKNIDEMAKKLNCFTKVKIYERISGVNGLLDLLKNKKDIKERISYVKSISPDFIVTYKDNDILNIALLDCVETKKKILIEEGRDLYKYDYKKENIGTKTKSIIKHILNYPNTYNFNQGENRNIDLIAAKYPQKLPKIKCKNKDIVEIPKNIAIKKYLDRFFEESSYNSKIKFNFKTPICLYLGQPLVARNVITREEENEMLNNIKYTFDQLNERLIIKPHPSENISKYNIFEKNNVLKNNEIPAELLPLQLKIKLAITFHSSGIDNLRNWFGIPTIYLYKIYLNNNLNMLGYEVDSFTEAKKVIDKMIEKNDNNKINNDECNYNLVKFINILFDKNTKSSF